MASATTAECDGCTVFRIRRLHAIQVGKRLLSNVMMAMPDTKEKMDTDGLLPTSLFRSIYISHSSGFVIVDPEVAQPAGEAVANKAGAAPVPGEL
jgi:hypothetical protein